MNQTLKQLASDLDSRGIAYAVIGAVALNQHGYQRFTSDIDILLTKDGLARFQSELVGRGYHPVSRAKWQSCCSFGASGLEMDSMGVLTIVG